MASHGPIGRVVSGISRQMTIAAVARSVCHGRAMAFGQITGPPATARQMRELSELLGTAGHDGFRDARGPMGFSQRQAGGKFTCAEAQAFIDQLEEAASGSEPASPQRPAPLVVRPTTARPTPVARIDTAGRALTAASDEQLLAEVRRRGLTQLLP
jgi:hypothetical protein